MPDGSSVPIDYVPQETPLEFSPLEVQEAFNAQFPGMPGGHISTKLTELKLWAEKTDLNESAVEPKVRPLIPFMRSFHAFLTDLSDQLATPEGHESHTLLNQQTARQIYAINQTPTDSIARKNFDVLYSTFQVLGEDRDNKIARDGLKMLNAARAQIGIEHYLQNNDFIIIAPTGKKEILAWDHKMGTDFVAIRETSKNGQTHYEVVMVDSKGLRFIPGSSALLEEASVIDYGVDPTKLEKYAERRKIIVRNALRAYGVNPNKVDMSMVDISHKIVTMPTDRELLSAEGIPNPNKPKVTQALDAVFKL